tara:strand:+ start:142 stop:333 length:192 start_codon:yes stop_codon:yes gene_type:complete
MASFLTFLNEPPEKVAMAFVEEYGIEQAIQCAKVVAFDMLERHEVEGYRFMKDVIALIEAMEN